MKHTFYVTQRTPIETVGGTSTTVMLSTSNPSPDPGAPLFGIGASISPPVPEAEAEQFKPGTKVDLIVTPAT